MFRNVVFVCFLTASNEISEWKRQGRMTSAVVKIWGQGHNKESKVDNSMKLITEQRWMELTKTSDTGCCRTSTQVRFWINKEHFWQFSFGSISFLCLNQQAAQQGWTSQINSQWLLWELIFEWRLSVAQRRHLLVKTRTCYGSSPASLAWTALVSEALPSSHISTAHCRTFFFF